MSDCERFEAMMQDHAAGVPDAAEVAPLLAHAHGCAACRALLEVHEDLRALGARIPEPDEARLEQILESVLVEAARTHRPARFPLARFVTASFARSAVLAAAVLALFACGLVAGRLIFRRGGEPSGGTPRLLAALSAEAASNRGLAQAEDSRFTYSNVSFRRLDAGQVALSFDVTTHMEVVENERSNLVREVLAQSLLDPGSIGARLKALSFAARTLDPKLRDAIILALRHDESLPVRLEALSILSGQISDPEVQSALMATLRDDASVQIRLLALESLAAERVEPERLREAIRERARPGDEALMVRLAEFEKEH